MMNINERAARGLEILRSQEEELEQINEMDIRKNIDNIDVEYAKEKLQRWKSRTVRLVAENINPLEGQKLQDKGSSLVIYSDPWLNFEEELDAYKIFLEVLIETLQNHPQDILDINVAVSSPPQIKIPEPETKNAIFIIHGHDELNLIRLKELLRDKWNFEPIIMAGEAGKGRTLIEKFEDEAKQAAFAVALLTPDDIIATGDQTYAQARPNVIFELGWFYGRLGRGRVCILFKKGTSIHSDLDGISRIEFDSNILEKFIEIENEFIAAGLLKKASNT